MMAIEAFGVFLNGELLYSSMSRSRRLAEEYFRKWYSVFGFGNTFEVHPICWSVERGEFIAVPDSISI